MPRRVRAGRREAAHSTSLSFECGVRAGRCRDDPVHAGLRGTAHELLRSLYLLRYNTFSNLRSIKAS